MNETESLVKNRKRGRPQRNKNPVWVDGKFTKLYRKWSSMVRRCRDKKLRQYKDYGGRGITVCDRWVGVGGFDNFVADMGECPEGLTLERKENSKGYSPDNCKWASWKEQASNRRNKSVDPNSLRQKAIAAGLPYHLVYQRVHVHHWPENRALTTAVSTLRRRKKDGALVLPEVSDLS